MHFTSCIALRADASLTIGTGHLRRCLSLAQALLERGASVHFLIRKFDNVATQMLDGFLISSNFHIHWLPEPDCKYIYDESGPPNQHWSGVRWSQDVDDVITEMQDINPEWMILDHYAFDERWHRVIYESLHCKLLVIDDLADRPLDADILLDQNWNPSHRDKYIGKLRRDPVWMVGTTFALLDKVYSDIVPYQFQEEVKSIGIFMGGTDPGGASLKALHSCRKSGFLGPVEVASISANPHLAKLHNDCISSPNTILTLDEPNLASFFLRHDLHIGAGGSATWERCCIAVPSITMALADNQRNVLEPLREMDILELAEGFNEDLPNQISALIANSKRRRVMCEQSRRLVDGRGAYRVANFLLKYVKN